MGASWTHDSFLRARSAAKTCPLVTTCSRPRPDDGDVHRRGVVLVLNVGKIRAVSYREQSSIQQDVLDVGMLSMVGEYQEESQQVPAATLPRPIPRGEVDVGSAQY